MDSSGMCSAQKCTFWQRRVELTTCKGPERLLRTSAVSDLDVPTTYHKCVSWVFKSLSRTVRMPQQRPVSARTPTSVPRTRSSFSAFAFTVTHIVKVTGKGATTTLPIPSPSHPCGRRRDRRSKLRKARRTKHDNKELISISLLLLILNLEEGDITLLGPPSLKTKVLPVAVNMWSSATTARLVVGSRHCHVSSQRRWPGCEAAWTAKLSGLMSATLARATAIFCSRKKSAKNHWISWHWSLSEHA